MGDAKYLYLTTTGHKTGKAHEIEIWYVEHRGRYYLVSEKRESAHWVRNIRANPAVSFRLSDERHEGRAAFPEDAAIIAAVTSKMDDKYGWSNGLIVELSIEKPPSA